MKGGIPVIRVEIVKDEELGQLLGTRQGYVDLSGILAVFQINNNSCRISNSLALDLKILFSITNFIN